MKHPNQPDLFENPAHPPAIPILTEAGHRELIQSLGKLLEAVMVAEITARAERDDEQDHH